MHIKTTSGSGSTRTGLNAHSLDAHYSVCVDARELAPMRIERLM